MSTKPSQAADGTSPISSRGQADPVALTTVRWIERSALLAASRNELLAEFHRLRHLRAVTTGLVNQGDLLPLLGAVLNAAITVTQADFGNIQLIDPTALDLKIVVQHGFGPEFLQFFDRVHDGRAACGTALKTRRRVLVEDVTNDPIFRDSQTIEVLLAARVQAVQSTPLISRSGKLLGMLSSHYRSPRLPSERELHLLDIVARHAVSFIERRGGEHALHEIIAISGLPFDSNHVL